MAQTRLRANFDIQSGLPHGNVINNQMETRWSMNCRFKYIFTYGDKKIGEFFEPVTLRLLQKLE